MKPLETGSRCTDKLIQIWVGDGDEWSTALLRSLYPVEIPRRKLIRKEGGTIAGQDVLGKKKISFLCRDLSACSLVGLSFFNYYNDANPINISGTLCWSLNFSRPQSINSEFLISLGAFTKLRKATISFVMLVRLSAWNNSVRNGRIFKKRYIWLFFENLSRKFKFHLNRTRIAYISHEDSYTFFTMPCSVFLRMRNVSDKSYRENQNTYFYVLYIFFEYRALCAIPWKIL